MQDKFAVGLCLSRTRSSPTRNGSGVDDTEEGFVARDTSWTMRRAGTIRSSIQSLGDTPTLTFTFRASSSGDDANREYTKMRDAELAKIDARVMPVINVVAKEGGYNLVFRKFESGLIYADDAMDITNTVIAKLDAATP